MDIVDFIFPKQCVGCKKWGKYVCDECEVGMWEEEQICPGCCRNSRYGLRHKYCSNKGYLEGLSCLWSFEGLTRKLIGLSKYKFYFDYLSAFTFENSNRLEFHYLEEFIKQNPTVVPVPLFAKRERERGFNQASIIGKAFASRHRLAFTDNWLIRTKDTGQQVGRSREERLKAMSEAFGINSKYQVPMTKQIPNHKFQVPNKVILVDDVWTTGTTMQECARTLKKAGVKQVWGWVLAR